VRNWLHLIITQNKGIPELLLPIQEARVISLNNKSLRSHKVQLGEVRKPQILPKRNRALKEKYTTHP
jgi:hypothetical protein